ncbi:thioesterase II family protein [Tenacibaculum halocynthiae]|uniref:thioesterase II family protein n=1 Tax=Tenacibaculum halocynthiae TaxID=1254437 RepID=UPI0038966DF8
MEKKIKLFCIPYAGGSSSIYNKWKDKLGKNIELCPIELAGRGGRIKENHYSCLSEAVNDILNQIIEDINAYDYAIFGHSMGAFLAYEVIHKIMKLGLRKPIHSFFSGRKPPGIGMRKKLFTEMNPIEFEKEVLALGGTPPEFFKYPELKELFIPLLRSDFAISETIVERSEGIVLNNNFSILIGKDENINLETAVKWRKFTDKECDIHFIKGDHFFLLHEQETVIGLVNKALEGSCIEVCL